MASTLRSPAAALVALVSVATACGSSSDDAARDDFVLRTEALVATGDVEEQIEVEDARLLLPRRGLEPFVEKLSPGRVVVGGAATREGSSNRDGFLRRVKAVRTEGERVVIDTESATLPDVVERGSFAVENGAIDFTQASDGLSPQAGRYSGPPSARGRFHVDVPRVTFARVDEQEAGVTLRGAVGIKGGHVDFTPTVRVEGGVDGSIFSPKPRLSVTATGQLDAALALSAEIAASGNAELVKSFTKSLGASDEKQLFKSAPQKVGSTRIGPIKIEPKVTLDVTLKCDRLVVYGAASAEAGVRVTGDARFGVRFQDGDWKTDANKNLAVEPYLAAGATGTVGGRCRVTSRLDVSLFGAAYGRIDAEAWVDAEASGFATLEGGAGAKCSADAGLRADFDGRVSILGKTLLEREMKLLDLRFTTPDNLCSGGTEPPKSDGGIPDSCASKVDGAYCSELTTFSGYLCKNQQIAGGLYCEGNQRCKGPNGPGSVLQCE